jgi:cation diffusion facilitator family transporter
MERSKGDAQARYGYLEGVLSTVLNLVLFGLKYWAGVVSGSVALVADAWHTLSDSLTSIIVVVGTKISSQPPDEEHPFGHGRAELIASVVIAVILSVVAIEFVGKAIDKLENRIAANYGWIAIAVTGISIVAKEVMAQLAIRWGKEVNMKSLVADGWHHRSDAISSVVILAGIFVGAYLWWIDAVLGLIVSAILFYVAYGILKESVSALIGEQAEPDLKQKLCELSASVYCKELHLHHVHLHSYGRHQELTFHIRLPDDLSLHEAHEIASEIETLVRQELHMEATVHTEPLNARSDKIA